MPLDKERILQAFRNHSNLRVEIFDVIDSTNLYLYRKAPLTTDLWMVAIADRQTAGRGRLGRRWESPPGVGLWFSILSPANFPEEKFSLFNLFLGIVIVQNLERHGTKAGVTGCRFGLKWPNDIYLNGKKMGGILIQGRYQGNRLASIITGIGLNINQTQTDFPDALQSRATSLFLETGKSWDREAILISLLQDLIQLMPRFSDYPADLLLNTYRKYLIFRGERVAVETVSGVKEGILKDVTDEGYLLLETEEGILSIHSGDVFPPEASIAS